MKRLGLGLVLCGFTAPVLALSAMPARAQAGQSPPQATLVSDRKLGIARDIAGVVFSATDPEALDRMAAGMTSSMVTPRSLALTQVAVALAGAEISLPEGGPSDAGALAAMRFIDPAFDRRVGIIGDVLGEQVATLIATNAGRLREAYARALVSRFTQPQLVDVLAFFRSPSGRAFARESLNLPTDPAYMALMQEMGGQVRATMPAVNAEVEKRSASLPQPRRFNDLSREEQLKFHELLVLTDNPS